MGPLGRLDAAVPNLLHFKYHALFADALSADLDVLHSVNSCRCWAMLPSFRRVMVEPSQQRESRRTSSKRLKIVRPYQD